MSIDQQVAITSVAAAPSPAHPDEERLMRWLSSVVSALTAAVSVLVVAIVAVMLGVT
jgi:hypothetical protein